MEIMFRNILILFAIMLIECNCYTNQYNSEDRSIVCNTKDCKVLGDIVTSGMNRYANPCDNFWEYVCGNFVAYTPIPPGEATWSRFSLLLNKVKDKTREILESNSKSTDHEMLNKAKKWYRSCMDTGQREAIGIKPLKSLIESIGGWPITKRQGVWEAKNISWQSIDLYYGSLVGKHAFYLVDTGKNYADPLRYKIMLKKALLPLAYKLPIERQDFDERDRAAYIKLIRNVAHSFIDENTWRVNRDRISNDVRDMVDFEAKLSKIKLGRLFQYPSIGYVTSHYNYYFGRSDTAKVNFSDYVQQTYGFGNLTIPETEIINVYYDYINDLGVFLGSTPRRTIANYVHWHFINDYLDVTNQEMNNHLAEFKRDTFGIQPGKAQWEICVETMHMHHAVATEFVKNSFSDNVKDSATKMVENLKGAMEQEILKSNWMDSYSKNLLVQKLRSIVPLIGYPNWYHDTAYLAYAYRSLSISSNYFNNVINWAKFVAEAQARILRITDTRDMWYGDPITVNAFYRTFLNNINLPAATLQSPIFSPDLPEFVNYAITGAIAGHEITHAFDPLGIHYDEYGKYRRLGANVLAAYFNTVECFANEYRTYESNNTIGGTTLNENIADNQGVRIAYEAYESLPHKVGVPDLKIPGLEEYSSEQVFFILFSSIWCSKETPEFMRKKEMDEEDHHSLARLRVIGTLSNMEDFAAAFSCPKGSPMNPQNKCNLWMTKA